MNRNQVTALGIALATVLAWCSTPMSPGAGSNAALAQTSPASSLRISQLNELGQEQRPLAETTKTWRRRLDEARTKLGQAQSDDEKVEAKDELRRLLDEIFMQDMAAREEHAREIEQRLAELRRQHEHRLKVKNEILALQMQIIELDADGPAATDALGVLGGRLEEHSEDPSDADWLANQPPPGEGSGVGLARPPSAADAFNSPSTKRGDSTSPEFSVSEYNELHKEYRISRSKMLDSQSTLDQQRSYLEALAKEPQVKEARINSARRSIQVGQARFEENRRAHESVARAVTTKLTLLELDIESARADLDQANAELERMEKLEQRGFVSTPELEKHRFTQRKLELAVRRAETIYKLFRDAAMTNDSE